MLTADGAGRFERTIARGRELLADRALWTVNSTARGGGVAEMLRSLIGYVRGAGIDARWVVDRRRRGVLRAHEAAAQPAARRTTATAGRSVPPSARPTSGAAARTPSSCSRSCGPRDIVLLHDPQTAGMVPQLVDAGVPVIWRAHIGLDLPNDLAREAWRFLIPYVRARGRVRVLARRVSAGRASTATGSR